MIGRLLDGRYQVRSRIARGGMATVYLATDLRLERRVAVKVMHGHLADDSEYKARFIQEARSAARLAHPNVVNVYDQGQDEETAYLVMEYLPGITLRDLLNDHKVLTTVQALDIMEAVLSGLAAAHKNGIVHRDLKPENVLLADDGRIKIGDFGLARAAHANTATGNALLGTIAYLSPELVTRGVADTRSDIYAIGIMLYEMLAGEQPFKGEQAFQVAQQHATDTVPTPSSRNPRVPAELDELVLWATARDPEQRPRDARVMLDQLLDTQRVLELADPATAANSSQRTMVMPTATAAFPAASPGNAATQVIAPVKRQRTDPVQVDKTSALARKSEKRKTKGFWLFALIILLAGAAGGAGWYFGNGPGSLVTIPDVSNQTPEAATATLQNADLQVSQQRLSDFDPDVPVDMVMGTDPEAGADIPPSGVVHLIISQGPEQLPFPDVAGKTEDEASDLITDARFTLAESVYQFNEAAEGIVLGAVGTGDVDLPAGGVYGEKQPVTLIVSLGPVPDVGGLPLDEAKNILLSKNLTGVEGHEEYSDTVPRGNVIRTQPQSDAPLTRGGSVNLIISKGIEQVTVPEVVGKSWRQANIALSNAGFEVRFSNPISKWLSSVPDNATVKAIDPQAGAQVDKGSTISVSLQAG
ncbi:MAG: pknB [Homoserinimonas sp.]|jgi:serine/threonine protein kinase/beta-lactam-binding protein with PASTA domain|nr:pknB [Homoserinimonas sp.]